MGKGDTMSVIRSWDMAGIISIKHADIQRRERARELREIAFDLLEEERMDRERQPWTAGVCLICSDYHSVVAWFMKIRGRINCRVWLWWDRLWIRKDEFHPSLNVEPVFTTWMGWMERAAYIDDVRQRRDIAHKRDLARTDQGPVM